MKKNREKLCPECDERLVYGDIRAHKCFHRLSNELDYLMRRVENVCKQLAPMVDDGVWRSSVKSAGFSYKLRADPKAAVAEFLALNPQLTNWKPSSPPTLHDECVQGLLGIARGIVS